MLWLGPWTKLVEQATELVIDLHLCVDCSIPLDTLSLERISLIGAREEVLKASESLGIFGTP